MQSWLEVVRSGSKIFSRGKSEGSGRSDKTPAAEPQKAKKTTTALVRSELNLEKNNVFTVSTYKERSREIADPEGNITITVGKMPDGTETGVLTTNHFKVYLCLMEFWQQAGRPIDEPVNFTTYRILARLDLAQSGTNYQRARRWLRELRVIPITFMHSFYDSGTADYVNLADTTILNHLNILEKKSKKDPKAQGEFQFDKHITQNLLANYVHPLRLDVIKSFKQHRDLAILLYTYIDRNMAFKGNFQVRLDTLFEHLDLGQDYVRYPSDRKGTIEPVISLLKGKLLSTGILSHIDIQKTQSGTDYKLVCRKKAVKRVQAGEGGDNKEPVQMDLDWSNTPLEGLLRELKNTGQSQ